jgi:hypothetical protein
LYAVLAQLFEKPGVQFDVRAMPVIGSPNDGDIDVCVMSAASEIDLDTWRRLRTPPRLGFTAIGTANHVRGALIASALGLPMRPVFGYQGSADIRLAMDRGEIEGTCSSLVSYQSTFAASATHRVVVQTTDHNGTRFEGVPSAEQGSDEEGQELLQVLAYLHSLDRYYAAPPNMSSAQLDLLRSAFDATVRDGQFLRDASAAKLEILPASATVVEATVADLLEMPATTRDRVAALLGETGEP